MQPAYLPWMGFFDLMDQVDEFVILDDVQFEKQSWQQRNRIKGQKGEILLTVPVKRTGLETQIKDAHIDNQTAWQKKHLQNLLEGYARASSLEEHRSWLQELYSKEWDLLSELNTQIIQDIAKIFGLSVIVSRSSDLGTSGNKVEKLLQI